MSCPLYLACEVTGHQTNGLGLDFGRFTLTHRELPVAWGCLDTSRSCPTHCSIDSCTKGGTLLCTVLLSVKYRNLTDLLLYEVRLGAFFSVGHNTRTFTLKVDFVEF